MKVQELIKRQLFEVDQKATITIASGQIYTLAIALLDDSGRSVNVDQSTSI